MDITYCNDVALYENAQIIDVNFKKIDKTLFEVNLKLKMSDYVNLIVNIPRCDLATMTSLRISRKSVDFIISGNSIVNSKDEAIFTLIDA